MKEIQKAVLKFFVFLLVFVIAFMLSSIIMNQGNTDMTSEMEEASQPVVYMIQDGYTINTLYGYTQDMELEYIRDEITPITSDRKISFQIEEELGEIKSISYEVRDIMGERLIEGNEILDSRRSIDKIDASVELKDLIQSEEEYNFIIVIKMDDGREIKYYTRIIMSDSNYFLEKVEYVLDFHNKTFSENEEEAQELVKYLESNSQGDNTTLYTVNIHSSFSQVMWADLNVQKLTEPIPTIRDISSSYATIELNYIVTIGYGKSIQYYNVTEYYRIRYTADRMYLLDYERTMGEIFDEDSDAFVNDKIVLGITETDVPLIESEGGNVIAFTNENRLYSYNTVDNKLINVFSFYDSTYTDIRNMHNDFEIKILDLEETGNITFIVYGYMNRGTYEGKVGIQVYYYSALLNTVEEQIFIPYTKSEEILRYDLNTLSYVNSENHLFFTLGSCIYDIDMTDNSYEILYDNVSDDSVQISSDNSMVVWQKEGSQYDSQSLVWLNLTTSEEVEITVSDGENILPLGFMNEDLIYGIAKDEDITMDSLGNLIFPMSQIIIQSNTGQVLKEYQKEGYYVVSCEMKDNQILLKRVVLNENTGTYEDALDDQITNNEVIQSGVNTIVTAATEQYETIVQIALEKAVESDELQLLTPKEVLYEGNRVLNLVEQSQLARYYMYDFKGIYQINTEPSNVVSAAYENSGYVLNDEGNKVWTYGLVNTVNQIMAINEESFQEDVHSLVVCLDAILKFEDGALRAESLVEQGVSSYDILQDGLGEETAIFDLSGCVLSSVLYYIDNEIPVLAQLQTGEAVLVVGYNAQNVVLFDPTTEEVYKMGINDATEMFTENGNHFITYVK